MAKQKQESKTAVYVALVGCQNDKTGEAFKPGDIVQADDFPAAVIADWLKCKPPILAAKEATHDSSGS
jgi:hypothetical protein